MFPKSIVILSLSVRYRDAGVGGGADYTQNITQHQTHPQIRFLDGAASYVLFRAVGRCENPGVRRRASGNVAGIIWSSWLR